MLDGDEGLAGAGELAPREVEGVDGDVDLAVEGRPERVDGEVVVAAAAARERGVLAGRRVLEDRGLEGVVGLALAVAARVLAREGRLLVRRADLRTNFPPMLEAVSKPTFASSK